MLISQRVLVNLFCGRRDPVPIREPSLKVAFFELLQEELNIPLEFLRVPYATGREIVIHTLLGELLECELSHQTFSERNFIRRILLVNFKEARSGQLVVTDLALELFMKDEAEQLLGLVMTAHEGLPEQSFDAGDVGGVS